MRYEMCIRCVHSYQGNNFDFGVDCGIEMFAPAPKENIIAALNTVGGVDRINRSDLIEALSNVYDYDYGVDHVARIEDLEHEVLRLEDKVCKLEDQLKFERLPDEEKAKRRGQDESLFEHLREVVMNYSIPMWEKSMRENPLWLDGIDTTNERAISSIGGDEG